MMRFKKLAAFIVILIFAAPGLSFADWDADAKAQWLKRDNQSSLNQAIGIYEKALAADPNDEALLIQLAIAYYWKGNNIKGSGSSDTRISYYQKGMEYANKACALNANSPGGNFWYGTHIASIGREKGIIKSVTKLPEIRKRVELTQKHEKYYYMGGPQRILSRIITKSPGFLRSKFGYTLADAEKMLKEVIAKYPKFTLTYIFLADVYIEMDKPELAKENLLKVLSIPASSMPEYAAENRRDKKEAKARLAKLNK